MSTWPSVLQKIFMGFRFMTEDHYSYATLVDQSSEEGRLFMENRFTTEPVDFLLHMWLVGKVSRVTGLGVAASSELPRMLTGFVFMVIAWCFTGLLFEDVRKRFLTNIFVG